MEHKLNVYADCQSEEPIKVYSCKRILFKTATKLTDLQTKSKSAKDEDQTKIMVEMLKCVFPDFVDEDLEGMDPYEIGKFFMSLGSEINQVVNNAQKN